MTSADSHVQTTPGRATGPMSRVPHHLFSHAMRRCTCIIKLPYYASRMSGTASLKISKITFPKIFETKAMMYSLYKLKLLCLFHNPEKPTTGSCSIAGPGNPNDSAALREALQHPSDLRYSGRPGALWGCEGQGVCHFDAEDKGCPHH